MFSPIAMAAKYSFDFAATFVNSRCFSYSASSYKGVHTVQCIYAVIFLIASCTAFLVLSPCVEPVLQRAPFCQHGDSRKWCENSVAYLLVYRICCVLSIFYAMLAAVAASADKVSWCRKIHHECWLIKCILLIIGIIASTFISDNASLTSMTKHFGSAAAFLFIIAQFLVLTNFCRMAIISLVTIFRMTNWHSWFFVLYAASNSVTAINCLRDITQKELYISQWFVVVISAVVSALTLVLSFFIRAKGYPRFGMSFSSTMTLYIIYMTVSAFNSATNAAHRESDIGASSYAKLEFSSFIELFTALFSVLFYSLSLSTTIEWKHTTKAEEQQNKDFVSVECDEPMVNDSDVEKGRKYDWCIFHQYLAVGALYVMMTLTNWSVPNSAVHSFIETQETFWVKYAAAFVCSLLQFFILTYYVFYPEHLCEELRSL